MRRAREAGQGLLSLPGAVSAVAWLQLRQVVSQPRLLFLLFVLPVVFSSVLSLFQSTQLGKVRIVFPEPRGSVAALFEAEVRRGGADLHRPDERSASLLARNEVDAILRFPSGLERVAEGGRAPVDVVLSRSGGRGGEVVSLLAAASARVQARLAAQHAYARQVPGALPEELSEVRRRAGDLLDRPAVSVKVVEAETQRSGEGVVASGSNQTTPGMTLMFALLFGAQTGLGLHRARAAGTIARLFAAPVPPIALLLGTVLGNALLLALQLTVMIAFGGLVLGVRWGNLLVIAFPAFAFAVMAASFGAFNAAVTRSQAQLTSFSFLVVAVTSALGGLWWPLEVTPVWMQRAASALPTYWGMQAFQTVMLRGGSILDVLLPVAVLLGFAAAFLAVGSRAFTYD